MRTIKADGMITGCNNTLQYSVNGKSYSVSGEFYYNNTRKRFEHIHAGKRNGKYLVVFYREY